MTARTKIYFASDIHLGALGYTSSREREARIVNWLDSIKHDAAELFLVGDVFDFWFEYKTVVPRGYIRFLGKLAELVDSGVKLYLFKGNHDMWMFDYFVKELNATIISNELIIERQGKRLFIHHGDGLGPGDGKYKLLKKVFRSRLCQWLFERLHPNLGVGVANYWSGHSRLANAAPQEQKLFENEWLVTFAREALQTQHYDYMVFGHRHVPMVMQLNERSQYVNLGEWINSNSYAVMANGIVELRYFERNGNATANEVQD
ncbi:UDP-2,3-diacylglucosamine diphosphatase [Mucilaginibacter aquatilis]|uniref:UDP-2,3-diacylglucosamine diphosphatase n=1 Tax=Mucilaginibacter aquatilis TaxID=1517760 RepID=A0A6I4IDY3_9SPHI|nr:UDP-2,3-diacylglucosamine diphosphatase [Mucilaginibacter aquatilis]MVN92028.1 UDP-2,3-diacylglucosamine diphosphatase [Mucilaginibacter aquatilis]